MKYGKSLLLGELISATEVDYEDVRENRFWIVCPVCNEAAFKVVRQAEDSSVEDTHIHYFSHYEASRSYATDCELRVRRITESDRHTIAVASRGQKLRYFIATLTKRCLPHSISAYNRSVRKKKELATNLSISTQKRIALDLLKHVTSPTGRPAFDTLFDHAYTWLTIRLETNIHIDRV